MTKVEIIEKIIETKNNELKVAQELEYTHRETVIIPSYKAVVDKYFSGLEVAEDIYTKVSSDGETITFLRPHDDYSYAKDVMDVRLRSDWKTGQFTEVSTSVYSTSDNSTWELERLQLVGQVASVLIDYKDDFIAEMGNTKDENRPKKRELRKEINNIEKDISSCREQINEIHLTDAKDKLTGEGLIFDGDQKGCMDIKWDWTVRGIYAAKIISKTASGKSADIELQCFDSEPRVFEKVRMSNIETLLWQYRDYVINA